jgi:hypothetical protein
VEALVKTLISSVMIMLFVLIQVLPACAEPSVPNQASQPAAAPSETAGFQGSVIETMNSAGYTYVNVDTGKEKIWAAAPETPVKVGDKVTIPPGMLMRDHHSKTLNRTFDTVYFVSSISVAGMKPPSDKPASDDLDMVHGRNIAAAPSDMKFSGIAIPKGGKTVSDIYLQKDKLSGKEVILRGKVVKFSPQIMGKNWMHIQDGTGDKGSNDLTITTAASAKVGDTVLVKGVLTTNKDFGLGYQYDIIIEDAMVTVE